MNGFGVGLACAVVFSLVACASEEVDQPPLHGSSAGRGAAGGHGGAVGQGGSFTSNTGGGAGRASQSGTAGSVAGASFNGAGGLGVAGASGGGSSVGSGGTSGTTSSAGSGGASPVFESGICASTPSMSLSYQQASTNSKQITGRYQFINTTDTPIPLSQLKIRYFFSDEETSGWSTAIYDAKVDGGTGGYRALAGTVLAVSRLGATVPGADSYIELSFSSAVSLEK
ncbi:MAG TPA: cellulose binding domain-containing protein, partial [Polyangiaceae bacterium]|nr:cellulose binding domain-containing protein [Polyangiaceae bacterium]